MKLTMPHMRMRSLLLLPLLLIPVALTTASLLIVRRNMQQELQQGLADDLLHSSSTFRNLERSRRGMLGREVILLADQPSLKALMTTQDPRTIENAAGEYARLSGSDLFALTSPTGSLLALYEGGEGAVRVEADPAISDALRNSSSSPFIYVHDKLYEIAAQPIYFGSRENGSVLGYLVVGSAIDHLLAQQVAQSVSGEVAFYSNHRIVSSSLSPVEDTALAKILAGSPLDDKLSTVTIGGGLYRLDRIQLSGDSAVSVEMILLKSMQALRAEETRLNHMTITLGIVAFIVGGLLALGVARLLTAPLEELAIGVRALGEGYYDVLLPDSGAIEVRGLSHAMDAMRKQIRKAQIDLVEAERLATIGKMASSVSHDVRHYLSSVYANAEFMASKDLALDDKTELLRDIQLSVQGTTDLIDSLLLFSRTGLSLNKSYESVAYLAERAIALLRNHPETSGVEVSFTAKGNCETLVDVKKIERVIYNLTLNACQSAQKSVGLKLVQVIATESADSVMVDVIDSGAGVPAEIRDSLFEPFISANKENGVGIGLTVASTIAMEHGGWVRLEETTPGRTVFRLILPRTFAESALPDARQP
jgi:signal transduction histidine kinase